MRVLSIATKNKLDGVREGAFRYDGDQWYHPDAPEARQELELIIESLRVAGKELSRLEDGCISFAVEINDLDVLDKVADWSVPYIRREIHLLNDDLDALEDIWEKAFPGVFWDGTPLQLCILYNKIRQGGEDRACTKFHRQRLMELIGGMPRMF